MLHGNFIVHFMTGCVSKRSFVCSRGRSHRMKAQSRFKPTKHRFNVKEENLKSIIMTQ